MSDEELREMVNTVRGGEIFKALKQVRDQTEQRKDEEIAVLKRQFHYDGVPDTKDWGHDWQNKQCTVCGLKDNPSRYLEACPTKVGAAIHQLSGKRVKDTEQRVRRETLEECKLVHCKYCRSGVRTYVPTKGRHRLRHSQPSYAYVDPPCLSVFEHEKLEELRRAAESEPKEVRDGK